MRQLANRLFLELFFRFFVGEKYKNRYYNKLTTVASSQGIVQGRRQGGGWGGCSPPPSHQKKKRRERGERKRERKKERREKIPFKRKEVESVIPCGHGPLMAPRPPGGSQTPKRNGVGISRLASAPPFVKSCLRPWFSCENLYIYIDICWMNKNSLVIIGIVDISQRNTTFSERISKLYDGA